LGDAITLWLRGDYVVSDATLNRFFALHVIAMPLVLVGLVFVHIIALHEVGSNNPDGVDIKKVKGTDGKPVDGIPFHPYYTVKDLIGVAVFLIIFFAIVFFAPEMGGYFLERLFGTSRLTTRFCVPSRLNCSVYWLCLQRLRCCFFCHGSIAARSDQSVIAQLLIK